MSAVARSNVDGTPEPFIGYRPSFWSGTDDVGEPDAESGYGWLAVHAGQGKGAERVAANSVMLSFRGRYPVGEIAGQGAVMVSTLVVAFDPDWAALLSRGIRRRQVGAPRQPVIGYSTWIRESGLASDPADDVPFSVVGAGRLFEVARIDDPRAEDRVIQVAERLGRNGKVVTPPIDRSVDGAGRH